MNGAEIGDGLIIAAGTLVPERTVVPPGSLFMGHPGKVAPRADRRRSRIDRPVRARYVEVQGNVSRRRTASRAARIRQATLALPEQQLIPRHLKAPATYSAGIGDCENCFERMSEREVSRPIIYREIRSPVESFEQTAREVFEQTVWLRRNSDFRFSKRRISFAWIDSPRVETRHRCDGFARAISKPKRRLAIRTPM